MRSQTLRFTLLAILPAWLAIASPASGQGTDNPSPSSSTTSSSPPVIKLPPFDVTAQKEQPPSIKQTFEKFNHVFDGPFPSLRSGPLIEAILWRHHYLTEHPTEEAVIVTTQKGDNIHSATTVYTQEGKVYGSSNALGEKFLIKGVTEADLHNPAGLARAKKYIVDIRDSYAGTVTTTAKYLSAAQTGSSVPPPTTGIANDPETSPLSGSVNPFGGFLIAAEDSGDYSLLAAAAGTAPQLVQSDESAQLGHSFDAAQAQWTNANDDLGKAFIQPFAEPSSEILSWTFQALHNSTRAGIVPVALAHVRVEGKTMTISLFENFDSANALEPRNITSEKKHVVKSVEAIVFDWEGVQYLYQPDIGTAAKPLPLDKLTGLPYLCIKNGGLMECAYFCAIYAKQHPNEKVALVPGDPALAAYQTNGKLGMFIPTLGRFTLPEDYWDAIGDNDSLGQLRDQLVVLEKQKGAPADVIPSEIAGDDPDMQMRRAFLAFQAAGISCHLKEDAAPSLDFTWNGVAYVYGSDQQVRPAPVE